MELRNKQTGAVITESEFRAMNRNTSFPATIRYEEWGYDVVFEGPQATVGRYQVAARQGVEEINGKWYTKWVAVDIDDEAKTAKDAEQAKSVRADRNKRISDCDWTQVADSPVDKAAWATYRQALRDIPQQAGFPWDIQWPDMP
jgi:hypothetical protein